MIRPLLRWLTALVLPMMAVCPAFAQEAAAPVTPPVAVLHPALWKVSDADTTIYLFGTIHLLRPGYDWLNGPLAAAVDGSDEIVTEVLDPSGEQTEAALLAQAMLPAGQSLRTMLDAKQGAALQALLAKIPLRPDALDRYKPWYAAVVLSSLPLVARGFNARDGVEAGLAKRLKMRNSAHPLQREGLETVAQQLALLDGLPRDAQIAYLGSVVADYDAINAQVDAMFDAWGQGDAAHLAALINDCEGKDDKVLSEVLILRRNRTWADWVRRRLDRPGTVFVAVGAGHLAGPGSVQERLAEAGVPSVRVQ